VDPARDESGFAGWKVVLQYLAGGKISRDGKSHVYGTFRASSELYVVERLK